MKQVFNKYGQVKQVTATGGVIETDPIWTADKPDYLRIVDANGDYYPLVGNPSNFLTSIAGIAAGGDLSGTYPNPAILNSAVLAKVLTGLSIAGSSISATDNILEAFGKIQNQINAVVGGAIFQTTWNASTNSPALADGVGTKGYYYVVATAGSTSLDGITDWKIGDWAIFDGTVWRKVDNTDAVSSVNGAIGAVSLTTADISEVTNLYFTTARVLATQLSGYTSGAGTVAATDTILQAIQKLNGNIAALTTASVPDSSNKRYVTDAQLTVIGNTSGTNTGDQTSVSGNAGTATTLQTARKINSVSFNGSADIMVDPYILSLNNLGLPILAQNLDGSLQSVINGQSMSSGRVYFFAVPILKDMTITGLYYRQITQGSFTGSDFNGMGLHTISSGTLSRVAITANDANIWKAASGTFNQVALASPYAATAGIYYVSFLYCTSAQSTAPIIGILGAASSINTVTGLPNSIKTSALILSQTSIPTSQAMSGLQAAATEYWAGLY